MDDIANELDNMYLSSTYNTGVLTLSELAYREWLSHSNKSLKHTSSMAAGLVLLLSKVFATVLSDLHENTSIWGFSDCKLRHVLSWPIGIGILLQVFLTFTITILDSIRKFTMLLRRPGYKAVQIDYYEQFSHYMYDWCYVIDSVKSSDNNSDDIYVDDKNSDVPLCDDFLYTHDELIHETKYKQIKLPMTETMHKNEYRSNHCLDSVTNLSSRHERCSVMLNLTCSKPASLNSSRHIIDSLLISHCLISSFISILISIDYIATYVSYVFISLIDMHNLSKETFIKIETSKSKAKYMFNDTKSLPMYLSSLFETLSVAIDTSEEFNKCLKSKLLKLREQTWLPLVETLSANSEMTVAPVFQPVTSVLDRIAKGERIPPEESMQYETLRFYSLRDYPQHNKPFLTRFARAGFYYANFEDEVICYVCRQRIRNWTEDDDPVEVHKRIAPNCRFHTHNSEVNVPIGRREDDKSDDENVASATSTASTTRTGAVECTTGACGTSNDLPAAQSQQRQSNGYATSQDISKQNHKHLNGYTTTHVSTGEGNTVQAGTKEPNGVLASKESGEKTPGGSNGIFELNQLPQQTATVAHASRPSSREQRPSTPTLTRVSKFPGYSTFGQRLHSFNTCPEIAKTHSSLAEAGFFYAGMSDCTKCFHCGIGLRHWADEDDPFIEHARYSEDCEYVRVKKGEEFLNLVRLSVLDIDDDPTSGYSAGPYDNRGPGLRDVHASGNTNRESSTTTKPASNHTPAVNGATIDDSLEIPEDPKDRLLFQKRLHKENEEMKRQGTCSGCLKKEATILFLPCGHLVTCSDCAPKYTECLACTSTIKGTIQTFRP